MKSKNDNKVVKKNKYFLIFIIAAFFCFIARLTYLCLVDFNVGSTKLSQFISNRNTKSETILPTRGTIYDSHGTILAQDVSSYKIIAYVSAKRSENSTVLRHVADKKMTATKLAPLLKMEESEIEAILSKDGKYQVEFGNKGKNLTQLEMEAIKNLNLPGIDFVESTTRYYPNGDYAAYTLGYTKIKEDADGNNWIVGEMGLEEYYNKELTGEVGYVEYEKDKYGYKIANGREYVEDAKNGDNIYLTIDNNIQLWTEEAIKGATKDSNSEWGLMIVADAKTGAILGLSSSPSFDPNIRNITSYNNPFVSLTFEPGSTMKTWTYLCAINNGTYDGTLTYKSGSKEYVDVKNKNRTTTISDWNKTGWGTITYDAGYAYSSNIGIANMMETMLTKEQLKMCLTSYGFGSKTNWTMKRELAGSLEFNYPVEVATAGYGQGITTTAMQHIQALSIISNNGEMLKPYIISKIVDGTTGEKKEENGRTIIDTVATEESITKIKQLMRSVINNESFKPTGSAYDVVGYNVIGKTGTAQIYDYTTGKYISGSKNAIHSFAGMFPMDNPQVIIYAATSKPDENMLPKYIDELIVNVGKYLNLEIKQENNYNSHILSSYASKDTTFVKNALTNMNLTPIIIGNGDKIINQYPYASNVIYDNDKVFLLTNNYDKKMLNLVGYSYKEVVNLLNLLGISYELEGTGYVYEQSIPEGTIINDEVVLIKLKTKY